MEKTIGFAGILFLATAILAIAFLYFASHKSKTTLVILFAWFMLQSLVSASGFYLSTRSIPPRTILLVLPAIVFIIILFNSQRGREYIDSLNPGMLCLLFVIRIPVEIVLYELYLEQQVPRGITFAGGNYDIFSGLTAPLVWYFGFVKKQLSRNLILVWNAICLALLVSVVVQALLSVPSRFQMLNLDHPTYAILYFPFSLLPSLVVPVVLFAHLAIFRILWGFRSLKTAG